MSDILSMMRFADQIHTCGNISDRPVQQWNPAFCGDLPLVIRRDGSWYYNGSPIQRTALVQLFSSVLRYENNGEYYLVTPVEKMRIQVEDVPFVIVAMDAVHQNGIPGFQLMTQLGDRILLDNNDRWLLRPYERSDGLIPYVEVRHHLNARIHQNVYYEMIDKAIEKKVSDKDGITNNEATEIGLISFNQFFSLEK
ncbi:hypothetical protein CI610_02220 [invertebrate metagenome]|uniref:Proteophosphoglycan n=1 Tax=invertebrate metagenome TaxID=1711999 RepID=A0A2H9T6K5_9ZZZZ